ncbi:hypothetical protein FACS1894151_06570 [Spirochaetia bacterium]|nr:hypothetical protein FACS1894151_06570 [Spirochaetia bacterium]
MATAAAFNNNNNYMNNIPYQQEKSNSQNAAVSNVSLFKELFSPYLNRYIYQKCENGLFDEGYLDWLTAEQRLTDSKIDRAIMGKAVIGYFLSVVTRCLCIDIDDHTGKGDGYLLSIYQNIQSRLWNPPSLLRRSPNGLHAFYFLEHPVPEILLIAKAREALRGVPVEVKPTSIVGLRIPAEKDLIDPVSFVPLNLPFEEAVNSAQIYHPVQLFGLEIMPRIVLESLKERRQKALTTKTWKSIAKAEAEYGGGIQGGNTNNALCELIPVYRSAGLTPEAAAAEFAALLAPGYNGEFRQSQRRLLQRVRSFYQHVPETRFNTLPERAERGLFTDIIAESIAALVTGPAETRQQKAALTARRRTFKKAVTAIEIWKLYIDGVISRKQYLEMWDYLYPYFKKNTKEGYYPLPRNLFKKLHEHYENDVLPFLKKIGYLERAPYKYSSDYGICYYYRINGYQFIQDAPKSEPKPPAPPKIRYAKAKSRAETIRAYKKEHPKVSRAKLAQKFNVSEKTIQRLHIYR